MTKPMNFSRATLFPLVALAPVILFGQATTPTTAPPPSAPVAASTVLQPALSTVESTLNALKIDKWKKGSVREEAGDNVKAILQDLKTNVPPLLADVDAAPGALSKSIPLVKHLDALYDVLLRVEEGARVSAPSDQVDQLEAALKQFGVARIQLYDAMTERATGQEKQVSDLQTAIKAHEAAALEHKPAPAVPAPCTPPKPAPHKKRTTPKPAQPAPGQPAQTPPSPPKPQ
jgi:hypothetical protein